MLNSENVIKTNAIIYTKFANRRILQYNSVCYDFGFGVRTTYLNISCLSLLDQENPKLCLSCMVGSSNRIARTYKNVIYLKES